MQQAITVLGFKRFNDEVEGKKYNFTKVLLQMPTSSKNLNAMGFDAVECNCGDSEVFSKFENMKGKLPAVAQVELELTNKGYEVLSIAFTNQPKA